MALWWQLLSWMPGNQHPYTFHLERVAEHCMPHLVSVLTGLCPKPGAVLVGAAAWNAYVDMPLPTQALDFVVVAGPACTPPPGFLPDILQTCVKIASTFVDVQHALAVLDVRPPRLYGFFFFCVIVADMGRNAG